MLMEKNFKIYLPETKGDTFLAKIRVFLPDRPGLLAELASTFARYGINITFFHYNRTEHPNRVLLEVTSTSLYALRTARTHLDEQNLLSSEIAPDLFELGIVDTRNILKIKVELEHKPGTLGAFAQLLAQYEANVIHMSYNEDVSETSATISLVTQKSAKIDLILKKLNQQGYYYSLIYKGAVHKEVDDIIGLNLAERFFFSLKKLLGTDDIEKLKKLVNSSKLLTDSLIHFSKEAGRHFEEGGIITKVLAFASASLMKTGERFSYQKLEPIILNHIVCHIFRLPTGGNISILESKDNLIMIDSSYGLYYEDVKIMLLENGLNPDRIQKIYLSHADADHAGMSGYFYEEFKSEVFLHRDANGMLQHENRAWGCMTPLFHLNHFFTVLVNEFTKSKFPETWTSYRQKNDGDEGEFSIIDNFEFGGHMYHVLESHGGHIPGQVFFFSYDSGLFFTADYLLYIDSLSPDEKELLKYPKFMMRSTNVDSPLFQKEMGMLTEFIRTFHIKMKAKDMEAIIVPGHGDYYPASMLLE
jgi:glyoxylase-like metal-dependent hydrolase (beta-lactamase superfamily II)/ACT domain-containing protein